MTTLLSSNDLAFFRSIAKTAAVLLVCLRIDEIYPGRAIADFEISDILEQDPRTINKQMRSLSASGLMLEQRENKYVVTVLGRNTFFAYRQETTLSIEETKITSATPVLRAQNVPHDMNDDESLIINDYESSSIIERNTKCAKYLEATGVLFGTPVSQTGLATNRNPDWVMAWISKAYQDRRNLTNPCGMIYSKLKKNERPPQYLLQNPIAGLPDEFLVAAGLLEETASDEAEESSADKEPFPTLADDTVNVRLNDGNSMSAAQAWQSVLGQLQMEMPRSSFDTWVRDTKAVHFEQDTLSIGVVNSYARDWLENRLQSTVERLLVGILNRQVVVEFVVAVETESV